MASPCPSSPHRHPEPLPSPLHRHPKPPPSLTLYPYLNLHRNPSDPPSPWRCASFPEFAKDSVCLVKRSHKPDRKGVWKHEKSDGHEDYGLLVSEPARKYAIVKELDSPVTLKDGTVVLRFEVRLQNGLECGGGRSLKLLVVPVMMKVGGV
ncbi:Calnexin-like protein [Triticum urartu]|uniref:Calnexin-like protein n=1 Tax=Triticum urartu TaxID=4572 RepID=M7ZWZ6_TRIUA|nr:Calnexin-like protein [Triticum urartu]